ncbi:transposase [Marinitoga sp. 1155]|uniref:transposase n=1 Tax=Marinitoga sp. 1155 TaxID=1428448 RepID=UPI0018CF6ED9|nr:transposase [Marinitoga sp. 1155]
MRSNASGVGRTGYSPVSMIKAILIKIIKNLNSNSDLIDECICQVSLERAAIII